jgi:TPR repeat protein
MQLLEKSAAEGYAPAQTTFAFILDLAEKDAQAVHWYRQAADSNDAGGLYGLGGMYAKGEGVEKDPIKAGQLIKQAAQLDHAEAMRYYAKALESGNLGFDAAPRLAAEWFQKAAERGDKPSMHRLKQAYTSGQLGLPVDADKARAWNDKVNQPD